MNITFNPVTITVIFKDDSTATFEHAIKWKEKSEKLQIIFIVENSLECYDYSIDDIATIVSGTVNELSFYHGCEV